MLVYLLCFSAGCFGFFLNIACGFGAGIFSMMFLPYVMESTGHTATLINIVSIIQGGWVCFHYRRKVRWSQVFLPFISYLIISTLTVYASRSIYNDTMKILLGVLLLFLSLYFLLFQKRLKLSGAVFDAMSAGAVGGVMSALFSIGGPPMSLYYSAVFEDDKETYLATIQSYFFLTNVYIMIFRFKSGFVTPAVLKCSAIAFFGMILGTWLGKKFFDRINAETMRKLIYILMGISGVAMLLETILV